ncbi:MAG: regulatory protein RecX [Pelotomaculum sp.]|jgi:regulatory protein
MSSEVEQAMAIAYRILSFRPRTRHEMNLRLLKNGFPDDTIKQVLELLSQYGYLDDQSYTRQWIKQRISKRGLPGIKHELLQKGIDQTLIEEAFIELAPEFEYEAAYRLVLKKFNRMENCSWQKIARFLQYRGFSSESISKVNRALRQGG